MGRTRLANIVKAVNADEMISENRGGLSKFQFYKNILDSDGCNNEEANDDGENCDCLEEDIGVRI